MNNHHISSQSTAYTNGWEHLTDELERLDILIRLHASKQQNQQTENPFNHLKGLVLSEEEIIKILADIGTPTPEVQAAEIPTPEAPAPVPPTPEMPTPEMPAPEQGRPKASAPGHPKASAPGSPNIGSPADQALITALDKLESRIRDRREASLREGIYLPLLHLAQLFQLTPCEELCLLICLAPELDRRYEKLYAYLQDDVTCRKPGVDLVLNLICRTKEEKVAARSIFDPQAPLLRYRLLHLTDGSSEGSIPLLSRSLKLDDRIVNFLLMLRGLDARLLPIARIIYPQLGWEQVEVSEEARSRIQRFVRFYFKETKAQMPKIVFYFYGPYGVGKRPMAEAACREIGLPLIMADLRQMFGGPCPFEEAVWLLGREAVLQPAALCLENVDYLFCDADQHQSQAASLLEMIRTFPMLTFFLGSQAWNPQGTWNPQEPLNGQIFIDLEFPIPDDRARDQLWRDHLKQYNQGNQDTQAISEKDSGILASTFRFTPGQIHDALSAAQNLACWHTPGSGQITMTEIYTACRAWSSPKLNTLACRIAPHSTWSDIVLPADQVRQLREICGQAKYRCLVYGEWGFGRKLSLGKGLNALFSGPPGTGKTMSAEVIASELGLELYKIDLSQVVSKYIGETEKNLHQIFREAQAGSAILFFDEADALFGKRSEVNDAHDRYANIEISYLLQKMEEFEGISILATNLRSNMDEALVRRLQVIVEFPFPDERQRGLIWKGIFPRDAPLAHDIDYDFLTMRLRLAGGNIKNIALHAAFLAAGKSSSIGMRQIMQAARREYQKMGKPFLEVDFGPYYQLTEVSAY